MSHPQQMNFVSKIKTFFPEKFSNTKVLEVGSLYINGTVRDFFTNCNYIGIDIGPGLGVDLIVSGHEYAGADNSFDTVISCECFEHNPYWIETFTNMIRVCKSGGLIVITCATTGRHEHGTERTSPKDSPLTVAKGWNYYKNLTQADFTNNFNIPTLFQKYDFSVDYTSYDLYFWGIKV